MSHFTALSERNLFLSTLHSRVASHIFAVDTCLRIRTVQQGVDTSVNGFM